MAHFFTLVDSSILHHFISSFSEKYFLATARTHVSLSPIYLIVNDGAVFFKKFPISATLFVMAYVVGMKGIFVDCGNFLTVSDDLYLLLFGV